MQARTASPLDASGGAQSGHPAKAVLALPDNSYVARPYWGGRRSVGAECAMS